ncbi:hypothetical protein M0R04_12580 [Candidatus Dojkabacteria bacterium]|jgi:hypothetical protein|nr:hypothetical protein [Candidatus Dojkabacteria bacterium]
MKKIPKYTKQWNKVLCAFFGHKGYRQIGTISLDGKKSYWDERIIKCIRCGLIK